MTPPRNLAQMTREEVSLLRFWIQYGSPHPNDLLRLCAEVERCWAEIAELREARDTLIGMRQLARGQYVTRQEMQELL